MPDAYTFRHVEKRKKMKAIIILVAIIGAAFGTVAAMLITETAFLQGLAGCWVAFIFAKTGLIIKNNIDDYKYHNRT